MCYYAYPLGRYPGKQKPAYYKQIDGLDSNFESLLLGLYVDVRRRNPSSIIHAVTMNEKPVAAHSVEPRSTRDIRSMFVLIHRFLF